MDDAPSTTGKSIFPSPHGHNPSHSHFSVDKENHQGSQTPTMRVSRHGTTLASGASTRTALHPTSPSQVLRQHLEVSSQHKKGLLQSGPGRLPKSPHPITGNGTGRVGVDGTNKTPSKELLRSTAASRRCRVDGTREAVTSPVTSQLRSPTGEDDESMSLRELHQALLVRSPRPGNDRAGGCTNPVAWTLEDHWHRGNSEQEPTHESDHPHRSGVSPVPVQDEPPEAVLRPQAKRLCTPTWNPRGQSRP
jgi:hypothetical protein